MERISFLIQLIRNRFLDPVSNPWFSCSSCGLSPDTESGPYFDIFHLFPGSQTMHKSPCSMPNATKIIFPINIFYNHLLISIKICVNVRFIWSLFSVLWAYSIQEFLYSRCQFILKKLTLLVAKLFKLIFMKKDVYFPELFKRYKFWISFFMSLKYR